MRIRRAKPEDAPAIAGLMAELGYEASPSTITKKLHLLAATEFDEAFVAIENDSVVGCISVHTHELFHADGRLGRITSLVVGMGSRHLVIGSALVREAEMFSEVNGCIRVEVTSGDHRWDAHRFYLANGYAEDERRFLKKLRSGSL
jgi:N-acetylglutamate synthase-like GNAT family acetyltransferase